MDTSGVEKSSRAVDIVLGKIKEQPEFLQWDREINGRLYYALWILFMGGFAISIGQIMLPNLSSACMVRQALNLFRALAVVGSAMNFFYQDLAIDSVRHSRELSIDMELHSAFAEDKQDREAGVALKRAEDLRRKLVVMDAVISWTGRALITCATAFLTLSLYITWNIVPTAAAR
ncbi:MAG: hypothetical protein ABSC62_00765 [Terracidiphilus sp.]